MSLELVVTSALPERRRNAPHLRRALAAATLLAMVFASVPARAGGSEASLAEALFQEGKRLMVKHRFAEACPKLAESYRLDPGGGTLLSLAICHEHEGKIASAWAEFKDAESLAKRDTRPDREKIAREHANKLEPKLQTLTVTIADPHPPQGFELKRDGAAIGQAAFGTPFPIDPGEHLFAASAPGKKPWTKSLAIKVGEKTVTLEVPTLEDEPVAAAPKDPSATDATRPANAAHDSGSVAARKSGPPAAALAVLGLGVVALGVGGYFALNASSKKSEADDRCPDTRCADPAAVEASEDAVTSANIANVSIGVGIVAAVVGVILLATSSSPPKKTGARATTTTTLHLGGFVGANRSGAGLGGTW